MQTIAPKANEAAVMRMAEAELREIAWIVLVRAGIDSDKLNNFGFRETRARDGQSDGQSV